MDNTLRYERGNRGSIPFGGTNCFNSVGRNSFLIAGNELVNSLQVENDLLGEYGLLLRLYSI
jgi:hypothetical protein